MRFRRLKPPTDREILACIYNEYYEEFASFTKDKRVTKMFVPVDFDLIGEKLGIDGDIPFGVLYYYLNPKYKLLEKEIGPDNQRNINAVHFPILAAVFAELNDEHRKHR